jgi:hypothetical protein
VIEFKRLRAEIPTDIAHPASKNFPVDDVLGDLLAEANILEEEELEIETETEVYIHKLNYSGPQATCLSSADELLKAAEAKIEHLLGLSKRNKYMVDEMLSRLDF